MRLFRLTNLLLIAVLMLGVTGHGPAAGRGDGASAAMMHAAMGHRAADPSDRDHAHPVSAACALFCAGAVVAILPDMPRMAVTLLPGLVRPAPALLLHGRPTVMDDKPPILT